MIVNPQLLEYVRQQSSAGVSKEEISKLLIASGWQVLDINKAFAATINPLMPPPPQSNQTAPTVIQTKNIQTLVPGGSDIKNLLILAAGISIAAGAGVVEIFLQGYIPRTNPFSVVGSPWIYTLGLVYGFLTGLFFSSIQPLNGKILRLKILLIWTVASAVSWAGAYYTAILAFSYLPNLFGLHTPFDTSFNSSIQRDTFIGIPVGGLIGALILAQAFNSISKKKISFRAKSLICFSGLFFAFVFGDYFTLGGKSLYVGWQATITGILLYYFLEFSLPLKRLLIFIFWGAIAAIVASILWFSVIYHQTDPYESVNNMLQSIVHSGNFPAGSDIQVDPASANRDMFNREIYPRNYSVSFTGSDRAYEVFTITVFGKAQKIQPKDSCYDYGTSLGSKKISDSFFMCYMYPNGEINGVDQGDAYFDGFLNPEKTVWAHVRTDMFLDPAAEGIPNFVKYYTGYTDAEFSTDVAALQKASNVTVKIPVPTITVSGINTGQTIHKGQNITFNILIFPAGKYDVGYVLVPEGNTQKKSTVNGPLGVIGSFYGIYDSQFGGYNLGNVIGNVVANYPVAIGIPSWIEIPYGTPIGSYHLDFYLFRSSGSSTRPTLTYSAFPLKKSAIAATSSSSFLFIK